MMLAATPLRNAPDLVVSWVTPEGMELAGASVESFGEVAAGETVTSTRQVRFPNTGVYKIAADASYSPSAAEIYRASGVLFFEIGAHESRVSEADPNVRDLRHVEVDAQVLRNPLPNAKRAVADKPCVAVSGNVTRVDRPLTSLAGGARCTVFLAEGTPAAARKQWLAGILEVKGELCIDAGAARALARGGSLLPVGLLAVDGDFGRGDAVRIVDADGSELGRGLADYSGEEMRILRGCRSEEIESRLGYRGRSVVVHRDDLVLFGQG